MFIGLFFYGILPLLQAAVYIQSQKNFGMWGGAGDMMNLLTSVLAYHWMQANLILGAKVPWLQRHLPYDKRIRFHIIGSLGIVAAVLYHGLYKLFMGYHLNPVTILLASVLGSLLILSVLWIPLPGFRKIRSALTARVPYDRFKKFHTVLASLLSALILIHVFGAGSFSLLPFPSRLGYPLLFILGAGLMILSRTRLFTERATVEGKELAGGILTLTLKGLKRKRKAGQFAFIGIPGGRGGLREHPFSYLDGASDGTARFALRLVGPFTEELSRLSPGSELTVRGGFGNFRPAGEGPVCLIGSGIGIVPLISLLDEWDRKGETRKGEVFFSVNSRKEIPRYGELRKLLERNGNLTLHLLVYEEDGRLFDGAYFRERLGEPRDYSYYLCSSPGVRGAVLKILASLGIGKGRIHYEAFSFG